jgi:hypothetical protein
MFFHPFWIEVAVVAAIAAPTFIYFKRQNKRIFSQAQAAADNGFLEDWVRTNWRTATLHEVIVSVVMAPLWEETLFRGPVVLLAQSHHRALAVLLGLVLNIPFALWHSGMLSGTFSSPVLHRLMAFILGLVLVVNAVWFGVLFICVIVYAAFNLAGGSWQAIKLVLKNEVPEGTPITLGLREGSTRTKHSFKM